VEGGFVEGSHSVPFFGEFAPYPAYGHQNNSQFEDFSLDANGNPVYMDFSWGLGYENSPPDDGACTATFRSCLRILDIVDQTAQPDPDRPVVRPLTADTTPQVEGVYEASTDGLAGYSVAEAAVARDAAGPGDPDPLGPRLLEGAKCLQMNQVSWRQRACHRKGRAPSAKGQRRAIDLGSDLRPSALGAWPT
jgi:hypothetical protein